VIGKESLMEKKIQSVLNELKHSVIQGDALSAERLVHLALENQIPPYSVISSALVPAMGIVGQMFEDREYFVPDVLMSAEAMKTAMGILKPHISVDRPNRKAMIVIGVIYECSQEIGKNLVATMLCGAGYEVHDLGVNVQPDTFVDTAKELGADIIAVGSPMNYTIHYIRQIIDRLEAEKLRSRVKVLIGGAGTTSQTAKEVGADAWAKDAMNAIEKVEELTSV